MEACVRRISWDLVRFRGRLCGCRSDSSDLQTNKKTDWIPGDPPDTRLHAPSAGARRTTGTRIGRVGLYSNFKT